jgi:hypothetical protein
VIKGRERSRAVGLRASRPEADNVLVKIAALLAATAVYLVGLLQLSTMVDWASREPIQTGSGRDLFVWLVWVIVGGVLVFRSIANASRGRG